MPPFALEAWIGPLVARAAMARRTHARLPHRIPPRPRARALPAEIERCAAEAGTPVAVDLVVAPPLAGAAVAPAPRVPGAIRSPRLTGAVQRTASGGAARPGAASASFPYRFDNFVVGSCNALAREAALAVARGAPARAESARAHVARQGLGKTHLARAIVNEARQHGETRAIYASAEAFTSEFTRALQARRVDEFKRRFRHGCRLLVIEDVQFLEARKKATQLELFHTLCHLLDVGARVVLTGDRHAARHRRASIRGCARRSAPGSSPSSSRPTRSSGARSCASKAADGGVRLPDECRRADRRVGARQRARSRGRC